MKLFIKNIFSFTLIVIVFSSVLDLVISNDIKTSTDPRFKGEMQVWEDIYSKQIKSDLAVYGSSRAVQHFNTEILDSITGYKTYNFGIEGQLFDFFYARHKEYLANNEKPKAIIMTLDFLTLADSLRGYNRNQLLPYMLFNKNMISLKRFPIPDHFLPLVRYYGESSILDSVKNHLLNPNNRYEDPTFKRVKGYQSFPLSWNGDLAADHKDSSFEIIIGDNNKRLFLEFLEECSELGISVLMVCPPHYEGGLFVRNKDDILAFYKKVSIEQKIPYLDYTYHPITKDITKFYNTQHLNQTGAEIFSREFANDAKPILDSLISKKTN